MFQHRGNHILKGATIKENNMEHILSFKSNNFKGHQIEKRRKLNYHMSSYFKIPQILNVRTLKKMNIHTALWAYIT